MEKELTRGLIEDYMKKSINRRLEVLPTKFTEVGKSLDKALCSRVITQWVEHEHGVKDSPVVMMPWLSSSFRLVLVEDVG